MYVKRRCWKNNAGCFLNAHIFVSCVISGLISAELLYFISCLPVRLHCNSSILFWLAELHGDLFSRHVGPLELYVFVAVDERGEHVMSDEICRRCNRTQQGRRCGGRSVQLPDSFMILHSSSRHLCTYTYVLYVRPNIFSGKRRKKAPSEVRSRDGHVEHVRKMSGCISLERRGQSLTHSTSLPSKKYFWRGKHVYFYVVACDYLVLV